MSASEGSLLRDLLWRACVQAALCLLQQSVQAHLCTSTVGSVSHCFLGITHPQKSAFMYPVNTEKPI